jgi:hypothetical protein
MISPFQLINKITPSQKKIYTTQQQHTNMHKHDKKSITLFISLILSYARRLCESCVLSSVLREYFCYSFFLKFVSFVTLRFLPNYI